MYDILLADGTSFELMEPFSPAPSLPVIAQSLSCINRFSGHTIRPYSVAEHSLLCYTIAQMTWPTASRELLAACLLHDAAESVTGDLASPLKRLLGDIWKRYERKLDLHIWQGIHPDLPAWMSLYERAVRDVDLTALWLERRELLQYQPGKTKEWGVLDHGFSPLITNYTIDAAAVVQPEQAASRFLTRARKLLSA